MVMGVAIVGALGTPPVAAQEGGEAIVGTWAGVLAVGPQQLELIYHIEVGEDGSLTGSMDVPAQGASGIPLTSVLYEDRTLTLEFPVPGGGSYEGTLNAAGDGLTGTFTQGGQSFPLDLARSEAGAATAELRRPQEPEAPFPYVVEDARFPSADGSIHLAGTLTLPEGDGPFPAAALITGSGPQNRDEALMGHKPFLVLADHLTRAGIAVLRYDDRGVAESEGDFSAATSEDFAVDALAAIEHLRADPRIDPARIGLVGHSEGGLVGPLAASQSDVVRYVVMLAGPGVPGLEILVEQGRLINGAAGNSPALSDFNSRIQRRLAAITLEESDPALADAAMRVAIDEEIDALPETSRSAVQAVMTDDAIGQAVQQMNSPWFRTFVHYDPRPTLERVNVPVLALFGEKDLQVPPAQSAAEVEGALDRGGNQRATVTILEGLNHLFQRAETGLPSEYQSIEETMSPVALESISRWIHENFGTASTSAIR